LVVDPFAEVFCHAVGGSWADVLDGNAPKDRLKSDFGEVFQSFLGARTRFFDDQFRRAAATFFSLISNEKHRDAVAWFREHWVGCRGDIGRRLRPPGRRPVPPPDTDGGQILRSGNLVAAKRR
jgi:hypothetical protein